jgi:transcriptional regulator of PTS gene
MTAIPGRGAVINDPRRQGRRIILSEIRRLGRAARVDLARETGISQATVTAITAELIRVGLIEETERPIDGEARRGRPRVDLKIRGAAHIVAGMKLAENSVSVALLDFEGELVGEYTASLDRRQFPAHDLLPIINSALRAAVQGQGMRLDDLSGVGIGIAGFVDASRGFVHWSPTLSERNVELRDLVARDLGLPVFLDNDVNLVAMAELYFGHGRAVRDFIVVTIESGVGAGIVLGGELYRGTRGCGAEFGHIKVQLDGALCRCGQRGCLEAYVADYAILREASISADFGDAVRSNAKVQRLIESARSGDATSRTIIERAGKMFALGLANLVNIFDPELIILSGERMQFDFLYADEVIDSIRQQIVQVDMPPPAVVIHKWGDLMWAKGAAAYAIEGVAERALNELGEGIA